MTRSTRIAACSLALWGFLFLAAEPATAGAGRTRPGGGSGSSSSKGGSSARGGSSSKAPSVASGRASYGYGHGHGHGHGGGGYHYGYGYYGQGGYYGLYPYYRYWGWPYYYGGGGYGPSYGSYAIHSGGRYRSAPGAVVTDIRPKRAGIWVDGEYVGQARDFSGRWDVLWLARGNHEFELRKDGYQTLRLFLKVCI